MMHKSASRLKEYYKVFQIFNERYQKLIIVEVEILVLNPLTYMLNEWSLFDF